MEEDAGISAKEKDVIVPLVKEKRRYFSSGNNAVISAMEEDVSVPAEGEDANVEFSKTADRKMK